MENRDIEDKKTIERILKATGITPRQIILLKKILELEKDEQRIHHIELYPPVFPRGYLAEVYLLKNFQDMDEFKNYLSEHNLPVEKTWREGNSYFLENEKIKAYFYKPS